MFPIRDHNPSARTSYVTWGLIAANVAIFLVSLPLFADEGALASVYGRWGVVPARIAAGQGWETLVSSQFLHGGWLHLIGNMLFLHVFGDNLEDRLGHLPYLAFYLACGAAAALAQVLADPTSPLPLVGASGAIAGVMGGYLLLYPRARIDVLFFLVIIFRIVPVPAWIVLGIWFVLQLRFGLTADMAGGGVAYWAHAGGFLFGAALLLPVFLRLGGPAFWARSAGQPQNPPATYTMVPTGIPSIRGRAAPTRPTGIPRSRGHTRR